MPLEWLKLTWNLAKHSVELSESFWCSHCLCILWKLSNPWGVQLISEPSWESVTSSSHQSVPSQSTSRFKPLKWLCNTGMLQLDQRLLLHIPQALQFYLPIVSILVDQRISQQWEWQHKEGYHSLEDHGNWTMPKGLPGIRNIWKSGRKKSMLDAGQWWGWNELNWKDLCRKERWLRSQDEMDDEILS